MWESLLHVGNDEIIYLGIVMSIIRSIIFSIHLTIYYYRFIKKGIKSHRNYYQWLTKGIRISCKKGLFLLCRHKIYLNLTMYCKWYGKVLSKVNLAAKKLHYNTVILNFKNTMKSTWKIINAEKGESSHCTDIQSWGWYQDGGRQISV